MLDQKLTETELALAKWRRILDRIAEYDAQQAKLLKDKKAAKKLSKRAVDTELNDILSDLG